MKYCTYTVVLKVWLSFSAVAREQFHQFGKRFDPGIFFSYKRSCCFHNWRRCCCFHNWRRSLDQNIFQIGWIVSLATAEKLSQILNTITIDVAMSPYRIKFSLVRLNLLNYIQLMSKLSAIRQIRTPTVFPWIEPAASIFSHKLYLRLLFKGGFYSRTASIKTSNFTIAMIYHMIYHHHYRMIYHHYNC